MLQSPVVEHRPPVCSRRRDERVCTRRTHLPPRGDREGAVADPIVVSGADDQAKIDAAFGAGAVAYVLKRARPPWPRRSARCSRGPCAGAWGGRPCFQPDHEADEVGLTRREKEILQLVPRRAGRTATSPGGGRVTEQTVKSRLANIFRKLDRDSVGDPGEPLAAPGALACSTPNRRWSWSWRIPRRPRRSYSGPDSGGEGGRRWG